MRELLRYCTRRFLRSLPARYGSHQQAEMRVLRSETWGCGVARRFLRNPQINPAKFNHRLIAL